MTLTEAQARELRRLLNLAVTDLSDFARSNRRVPRELNNTAAAARDRIAKAIAILNTEESE